MREIKAGVIMAVMTATTFIVVRRAFILDHYPACSDGTRLSSKAPKDVDSERSQWDPQTVRGTRIGAIVMSAQDMKRQMAFWCSALDYVPREPPTQDWVVLRPRAGGGPNLSLAQRGSKTSEPPRLHLDIYTVAQSAEVDRLIALGAERMQERNRPPDADYVMLRDPEGNRFCVVDKRPESARGRAHPEPPCSPGEGGR